MLNEQRFEQLIKRMEEYLLLSVQFKLFLRPLLPEIQAAAGTLLVRRHQISNTVTFILEGTAEQIGPQGALSAFWKKNDWVFTAPGFFSQEPAQADVRLREDSLIIQLEWTQFVELKKRFPEAEKLSELIRDDYQRIKEAWIYDLSHKTNEEKYEDFKQKYRSILYSASQYKLAAYLGMSHKTFSRIHNRR